MRSLSVAKNERATKLVNVFKAAIVTLAIVGALALVSELIIGGSKRNIIEATLIAILPLALYAAIMKPFIFPFSLFVVLVPFDNLLHIPGFGTLTKLLAIVSGAAFIFWYARNRRHSKPSSVVLTWLVLLLWMSLSVFWAIDPEAAVQGLATHAELILLYVVVSVLPISEVEFKTFLWAVIVGGVVSAAVSLYLFHNGIGVTEGHYGQTFSARVIVQTAEEKIDPNEFAAALLLPASLLLTFALQRRRLPIRLVSAGMFVLLLAGMYVSGSRGALVALAVLLGYMLWKGRYKFQVLTMASLGLAVSFFMHPSPWGRFANAAESGGAGRVSIWKVGFDAFKHYWSTGAGVANFPFAYDRSLTHIYQSNFAFWHRPAHNEVLTAAVELGLVGLVLFLCAWYGQFRILSFIRKGDPLFDLRIALESSVIGLFVASQFLLIMTDKFTWMLFGLMAVTRSLAISRVRPTYGSVLLTTASPIIEPGVDSTTEPAHA